MTTPPTALVTSVQPISESVKTCSVCEKELSIDAFPVRGYTARCKTCRNAIALARYYRTKKRKDKVARPLDMPKTCTTCGVLKPADQFRAKLIKLVNGSKRYLNSTCRPCEVLQHQERVRANPKKYAAIYKKYNDKPGQKAKRAKRWAEYYALNVANILARRSSRTVRSALNVNQKRYRSEKPELFSAARRRWQKKYPQKVRDRAKKFAKTPVGKRIRKAAECRRRARLKQLPVNFTATDFSYALEWFGSACAYCGVSLSSVSMDHVVPVSAGGGSVATNLVPSCKSCNSSKNWRRLSDWLNRRPDLNQVAVMTRIETFFQSVSSKSSTQENAKPTM